MDALIPVFANRPAIIYVDGVTVYLSIRDVEYFRVKAILKAAMVALHPDRLRKDALGHKARPRTGLFRDAHARFCSWLMAQRTIYWSLDQMPPDWKGVKTPPPGRVARVALPGAVAPPLLGRWQHRGRLPAVHVVKPPRRTRTDADAVVCLHCDGPIAADRGYGHGGSAIRYCSTLCRNRANRLLHETRQQQAP